MQYKFLLQNMSESDQLQAELATVGIHDDDIHFVTERADDFAGHNVHAASIFEERDLIHSSIRGAIVGVFLGSIVSLFTYAFQPYGWDVQPINIALLILLFTGFGGWIGGLFGISHRNYRISQYEDELQEGKAIMLVYTDNEHAREARRIVEFYHPEAQYLGQDSSFDNPFKSQKMAELED